MADDGSLTRGEFLLLAVLRDAPLHGYAIAQQMAERTGGKVNMRPGNLYRVLDRLMERGLLEHAGRRPPRVLDDERRTYYRLTVAGRRALAEEAELLAGIVAGLLTPAKG
jgi:DNA-binding PadR family transcriptional regulator